MTETRINFRVVYPDTYPGEYGSLEKPDESICLVDPYLPGLIDRFEIVMEEETVWIQFDYPLNNSHIFTFYSKGGFTREDIVKAISQKYKDIYDKEEKTSTIEPMTCGEYQAKTGICKGGMYNRITTDGKYEIYGWQLKDLCLTGVEYNSTEGIYILHIDS